MSRSSTGVGEPARSYLRERRLFRQMFRISLMSDAKWRKLFMAIDRLGLDLPVCHVKWIDRSDVRVMSTPSGGSLNPPRPFIDSAFGSFALCGIEWLEFPRIVQLPVDQRPNGAGPSRAQDLERAFRLLGAVARFPTEYTPTGLRIVGHVR